MSASDGDGADPGGNREAAAEPAGAPSAGDAEPTAAPTVGWLPRDAEALFGRGANAALSYGLLTVDVPAEAWLSALGTVRSELGCDFFDWLSAVDEPGLGIQVCAHLVSLAAAPDTAAAGSADPQADPHGGRTGLRRLVLRTVVPHEAPELPSATGLYAGAAWHERETHEMFGVVFAEHPGLDPLLLPDGFEGHPLRKEFVLAARVAKAWPGAKEPGESGHGGPKRRQMLPPGVPDPNEWGPLKGQLPPAASRSGARAGRSSDSRPARGRRTAGGERPPRRTRSASAGSASQRTAAERPEGEPPEGERPEGGETSGGAPAGSPGRSRAGTPRSSDAPWLQPGTESEGTGESGGAGEPGEPREPEGRDRPRGSDGGEDG